MIDVIAVATQFVQCGHDAGFNDIPDLEAYLAPKSVYAQRFLHHVSGAEYAHYPPAEWNSRASRWVYEFLGDTVHGDALVQLLERYTSEVCRLWSAEQLRTSARSGLPDAHIPILMRIYLGW
jgi:hypothetical protein